MCLLATVSEHADPPTCRERAHEELEAPQAKREVLDGWRAFVVAQGEGETSYLRVDCLQLRND